MPSRRKRPSQRRRPRSDSDADEDSDRRQVGATANRTPSVAPCTSTSWVIAFDGLSDIREEADAAAIRVPPRSPRTRDGRVVPTTRSVSPAVVPASPALSPFEVNASFVHFGDHRLAPWYFSPLPSLVLGDFKKPPAVFFCDRCGRDFLCESRALHHIARCCALPPGMCIYRDDGSPSALSSPAAATAPACRRHQPPLSAGPPIAVFELQGNDPHCCPTMQRYALLCKFFIDQKMTFASLEAFFMYALFQIRPHRHSLLASQDRVNRDGHRRVADTATDEDDDGSVLLGVSYHLVGFFTKERSPLAINNLSCIAILPPYQRRSYGGLLIRLSYELSKAQRRPGTPERPISGMGQAAYARVWKDLVATSVRVRVNTVTGSFNGSGQPRRASSLRSAITDDCSLSGPSVVSAKTPPPRSLSVADICEDTGMLAQDVTATLTQLGVRITTATWEIPAEILSSPPVSAQRFDPTRLIWTATT